MTSYDFEMLSQARYGSRRERSTSPFQISSAFRPMSHQDNSTLKTVSLSAVCSENVPYFTRPNSPLLTAPYSWRQTSPEVGSYDFAWNRPGLSRMTSPLSSHADCSLTEDGSNTLSPHIASTFDPTDYAPHSFPGSPQETWVNVDELIYNGRDYQQVPYSNGSSSAILNVANYQKPSYELHMPLPLPSQGLPLFAAEGESRKRKYPITVDQKPSVNYEYQEQNNEDDDNAESDYAPRPRKKTKATRSPKSSKTKVKKTRPSSSQTSTKSLGRNGANIEDYIANNSAFGTIPCPHCPDQLHSKTALIRHIAALHTRLFACTFRQYGCNSTFGSKNEWKRHVATKHLRTGYWQCAMGRCAPAKTGDHPKEFNRKDLFMQHVRRMHMPTFLKDKKEMDASLDSISKECYKHVRDPPPHSICGFCYAAGQPEDFHGLGSWECRMEHVGKHLESPGSDQVDCVEDRALENWLIREKLIVDDGTGSLILRSLVEDTKGKR